MRTLLNFLFPGLFLIAGTIFFVHSPYLVQITRFQVNFGATILVILFFLLAWRFDRSRIIYTLQLLFFTDLGLHYLDFSPSTSISYIITALLLINLMFIALMKERGIHSFRGAFVTSLPIIQAAALFLWFQSTRNPSIPYFETSYLNLNTPLSKIPEIVLLLVILALLIQAIRFLRYPNPLEGAIFWTSFGVAATLFLTSGIQITLLHAAAVFALLISFIETSYSLAYRDELTGVPGRRALMEAFNKLRGRYSIAMVDIDFFKKFNDKYGHDIGDQVLKMVAGRLAKCNGGGRAFRYGGEEFCVVFTGKNVEECLEYLEELRASIADVPFTIRRMTRPVKKPKKPIKKKASQNSVSVTVSIGVAEKTPLYNQPETVMKQSDLALYRAKESGRNKVCS